MRIILDVWDTSKQPVADKLSFDLACQRCLSINRRVGRLPYDFQQIKRTVILERFMLNLSYLQETAEFIYHNVEGFVFHFAIILACNKMCSTCVLESHFFSFWSVQQKEMDIVATSLLTTSVFAMDYVQLMAIVISSMPIFAIGNKNRNRINLIGLSDQEVPAAFSLDLA